MTAAANAAKRKAEPFARKEKTRRGEGLLLISFNQDGESEPSESENNN